MKKSGGTLGFNGHVKGDVDFSPGGTKVGAGSLDLKYEGDKLTGGAELKTLALKFGDAAVKINDFKLSVVDGKAKPVGKPSIQATQTGLFDIKMNATFGDDGITGFDIVEEHRREDVFGPAAPSVPQP